MKYHSSIHLIDNIYCYMWHGMGNNCNSCVLTDLLPGGKPHILIDPGHVVNEAQEDCFSSLTEAMEADGLRLEDLGLIVNTHSHPDHIESDGLVIEKSGAAVAMSAEEDAFRNTTGKQLYDMFDLKPPEFQTGLFLKEGNMDGLRSGRELRVLLTPGHSPGSVCLYLPGSKVLITGDVVFYMSVGRTDFPGGDIHLLKQSIARLSKLDVEYMVPGHNTEPRGIIEGKERIRRNFAAVEEFFT
jgi:hydroxyacylglutathione hydrolase